MSSHEMSISTSPQVGSDRNFGLVFAGVSFLIGFWPLMDGAPVRMWAIVAGAGFLSIALLFPKVLHFPNRAWAKLGILMGRVVTPVVMLILFAIVMVPIGLLLRKRFNHMKGFNPKLNSYWIDRSKGRFDPEGFQKQF